MDANSILESLQNAPADFYIYGGIALAGLIAILWMRRALRRRTQKVHAFRSSHGDVVISQRAIEDIVFKACASAPGVGKCEPKLLLRGGKIKSVDLRVQLFADTKVSEIKASLDRRVNQALSERLGIDVRNKINVVVVEFAGEPTIDESAIEPASEAEIPSEPEAERPLEREDAEEPEKKR